MIHLKNCYGILQQLHVLCENSKEPYKSMLLHIIMNNRK